MYLQNSILSDLSAEPIPLGTRAYIGQRAKNSFYDYVMGKFYESGISKAGLARKLDRNAGQINRTLANPGNWTIETMAELLAAISAEELLPRSESFKGRTKRNHRQEDTIPAPQRRESVTRLEHGTKASVRTFEFTV